MRHWRNHGGEAKGAEAPPQDKKKNERKSKNGKN